MSYEIFAQVYPQILTSYVSRNIRANVIGETNFSTACVAKYSLRYRGESIRVNVCIPIYDANI